jgi:hypothetical protein
MSSKPPSVRHDPAIVRKPFQFWRQLRSTPQSDPLRGSSLFMPRQRPFFQTRADSSFS